MNYNKVIDILSFDPDLCKFGIEFQIYINKY